MATVEAFEAERSRLTRLAARVLDDHHEAEDIVQTAWLRFEQNAASIDVPAAWLTTVTTRLCLDRLRARVPEPAEPGDEARVHDDEQDPAATVERTDDLGRALAVVRSQLTPNERVSFVLADSFGYDFATIGVILDRTPAAARKLASRAREKLRDSTDEDSAVAPMPDWQVVDAFMAAARGGDLTAMLKILAPDATVTADAAAIALGTPTAISGSREIAGFFNGSATSALPVFVAERPGMAWFNRGQAMVAFDFTVVEGRVRSIVFRAAPEAMAQLARRREGARRSGSVEQD